jgi:hypothetical protein
MKISSPKEASDEGWLDVLEKVGEKMNIKENQKFKISS